ncbi:MAG: VOC family protein [Acetobacteraceae bacterium]|nr:VOC family protein [Acetobacteraceae bacterium]
MTSVRRIARISLITADVDRSAEFYRQAFGFEPAEPEAWDEQEIAALIAVPGGRARLGVLRLGSEAIELIAFTPPGKPYPPDSTSLDPWFQHFAIVVADMRAALARLRAVPGWTAISAAGPVHLPESSGGVTAFKFRDPEGHPLELLQFPPDRTPPAWQARPADGPCLGIDHSAIVVANTATSVDFYRQLGFAVTGGSLNRGDAQERLDSAPGAEVDVTALAVPGAPGPHLELLCYRSPRPRPALPMAGNDVAATRLVLEATGSDPPVLLRDPDGHALLLG